MIWNANAIYNMVLTLGNHTYIQDYDLLRDSVRECVFDGDYQLCKIKGVTSQFMSFQNNDEYWNLISIIQKFECQTLFQDLFDIRWSS